MLAIRAPIIRRTGDRRGGANPAKQLAFVASLSLVSLLLFAVVADAGRVERLKLTAPDAAEPLGFGTSVDLFGNTAIVGSYSGAFPPGVIGTAYLFDIASGDQLLELRPSGPGSAERFGQTVAVSDQWAVVGAPYDDEMGSKSGAAYVFDVANGQQVRKLKASDGEAGDRLGFSLAMDGDLAIIGAWGDDDGADESGAAYVFDVKTGEELFKLSASDAMADDRFSSSVAINGKRAIVGTFRSGFIQGTAYVFDTDTGQEVFKLNSPGTSDAFGELVAINGKLATVGAFGDSERGMNAGAVYVFDAATGDELYKLTASDAMPGANFGGVAIDDDSILVSAAGAPPGGTGAAYLFDGSNGTELLKLRASDGAAADFFGGALAISGNRVIIGASGVDGVAQNSGAVYVFYIPEPSCGMLSVLGITCLAAYLAGRKRKENTDRGFTF